MRIFTITYHIDYWSGWLSCRGRDLTPVYDNFRDYGHRVEQRKPFNQRVVKGKSRESKKTFHSNESYDCDEWLTDREKHKYDSEVYNARFFKYKPSPRNKAKARWSKGGDNMARINCEFAMRPHCYRYDGRIEWDSSCNIGANKGRAWWRDAHQYAYLKHSLCTKGVDGITGWCDFGGKWMKRRLSKHERRNGKNQLRKDIEELYDKEAQNFKSISGYEEADVDVYEYSEDDLIGFYKWEYPGFKDDSYYDIPDYAPGPDYNSELDYGHE